MDRSSKKLLPLCDSCSLNKPPDKKILYNRCTQPDIDEKTPQAELTRELFQNNVPDIKEITSCRGLAFDDFHYSWHSKRTPPSCAFVEWKTMETSMEDGLLCRAAVSRTSNEHDRPWEMSKSHADSSDNLYQFDSLHYGSRQDYRKRLRKASMMKELKRAGDHSPEFFEWNLRRSSPANLKGEAYVSNQGSTQRAWEIMQMEEHGDEVNNTSCIVESLSVETSREDNTKKNNAMHENTNNVLPSQSNETELMDSATSGVQDPRRQRRFPPPLPSLRKTSSLLPHKVPSLLLKPIRKNGRFILQKMQVDSQMVFQPIRKDGRLQLRLFRNGNKNAEQHISSRVKSANVEFTATDDITRALILATSKLSTSFDDSGRQPAQLKKVEEIFSSVATEEESVRNLALERSDQFIQETGKESADPSESEPVQEMLVYPHVTQGTRDNNSMIQKLGSFHHGVLQTMQRILFPTQQHHNVDKDYQNELITNFAARRLKLPLCKEATLRKAGKRSMSISPRNVIAKTRANSVCKNGTIAHEYSRYMSIQENSFHNERRDPENDSPPCKNFHMPASICSIVDSQDPSMQNCRYKSEIRRGDAEGIVPCGRLIA